MSYSELRFERCLRPPPVSRWRDHGRGNTRLQRDPDSIFGAQRDEPNWLDDVTRRETHPVALGDGREDDLCFRHGKTVADADARPAAKRQIGEAMPLPNVRRGETLGVEALGLRPQIWIAMRHIDADRDQRAWRHAHAADSVLRDRGPRNRVCRRVEPQTLLDDHTGPFKLGDVGGVWQASAEHSIEFVM